MSNAQHTPERYCAVMAALDARHAAHKLRRMGFPDAAKAAWNLVSNHLRVKEGRRVIRHMHARAAIAKAKGQA